MSFWCKLGLHGDSMQVVKRLDGCQDMRSRLNGEVVYTNDIELVLCKCKDCGKIDGYIESQEGIESISIGFTLRQWIRKNPKLAEDPFVVECSKL